MRALDAVTQRLRRIVERWLPWYDAAFERRRTAHTEAIRQRSIAVRIRTERRMAEMHRSYRSADRALKRP